MHKLHQLIATNVEKWRTQNYVCTDYPTVAEILEYQIDLESGARRFLRSPQIAALETYWYLRIVENTPHIFDLYKQCYTKKTERMDALSVPRSALDAVDLDFDEMWDRIRTDDEFVKDFKLESLRETMTLHYPSYILALAMGAGKTILIGSIIATEFALAMEYPDGPFVQNALVFAPGKTIIESLRQLAQTPYDKILPPRLYKPFAANLKLTFTRDGDPDIPVIRGSVFNAIITNTEKIRITKDRIRKADLGQIVIPFGEDEEAKTEVANRRLQAIANFTFLTQETNLEISNRNPQEYFEEYKVRHPGALETHWIPMDKDLWKIENYLDFLTARRKLLAEAANNFLKSLYAGKVPVPEVAVEDITHRKLEIVPGVISDKEEEELILECALWVEGKGLPPGEVEYEIRDVETEQPIAVLDLAWPEGLQPGLSKPVTLLINEGKQIEQIVNQQGYLFFTTVGDLKKYIKREILYIQVDNDIQAA